MSWPSLAVHTDPINLAEQNVDLQTIGAVIHKPPDPLLALTLQVSVDSYSDLIGKIGGSLGNIYCGVCQDGKVSPSSMGILMLIVLLRYMFKNIDMFGSFRIFRIFSSFYD